MGGAAGALAVGELLRLCHAPWVEYASMHLARRDESTAIPGASSARVVSGQEEAQADVARVSLAPMPF